MQQASKLYLIKDLARLSGYSIYTLKFYLKRGILKEAGRSAATQFRFFDDESLETLARIRVWRKEGKGLADIQERLRAPAV